jgi:hypothetical protein
MMRALKSLSLFGGLAVVLTLFFIMGCSNNTPLQPNVPDPLEMGAMSARLDEGGPTCEVVETYDSKYIEKSVGGEIEVERGEFVHNFAVESYSIPQDTLITIRSVNEVILGKQMIVFEFGPDGLKFSKAATLQFEMAELGVLTSTAKLYYYDSAKSKWSYVTSVGVVNGIASFDIDHFSKYAISD